jgi:hypothetical protein
MATSPRAIIAIIPVALAGTGRTASFISVYLLRGHERDGAVDGDVVPAFQRKRAELWSAVEFEAERRTGDDGFAAARYEEPAGVALDLDRDVAVRRGNDHRRCKRYRCRHAE